MTKPVWSHVLTLSAWSKQDLEESSYSQLQESLSPDNKFLHARQIPHQIRFPF